tara:strand:+ start:360 stop:749 length:390 start_codon:yes stop_codon:yes gene_type:complete
VLARGRQRRYKNYGRATTQHVSNRSRGNREDNYIGVLETDTTYAPCVRSGFCCKQKPCPFGKATSKTNFACVYLGGDEAGEYYCEKYEEIQAGMPENGADFSPAFNTGCSSTLFNPARTKVILKIMEGR